MTRKRSRLGAVVAVLAAAVGLAAGPVLTAVGTPAEAARIMSVLAPLR
jgi:hypothetical protein